jgi:hypothetical protein
MDLLIDIAKVVQGLAFLAGFFAAWVAYSAWKEKQSLDRRCSSVAYSLTKNMDYYKARQHVETSFQSNFLEKTQASVSDVKRKMEENPPLRQHLRFLLAHWEIMAIQIAHDSLDEKACFEMVGLTLVDTVYVFQPYIEQLRTEPANGRRYDYLLIISHRWRQKLGGDPARFSRYRQYVDSGYDYGSIKTRLKNASWENL